MRRFNRIPFFYINCKLLSARILSPLLLTILCRILFLYLLPWRALNSILHLRLRSGISPCTSIRVGWGSENPSHIEELTVAAIQSVSAASSLRNAVADSAELPNKATFQHLFMRGLLKNTRPTTQVLPELSEVLPVLPVSGVITKVDGRVDFFVDGASIC